MKIEHSITLSGKPLKRKVSITDFKSEGGVSYMRLSKQDHSMIGVLNIKRLDDEGQRMLSHTDVFEKISQLRTDAYNREVLKVGGEADHELQCFGGDESSGPKRVSRAVRADLPAAVNIKTPDVGDVLGIDASVLLGNAHAPLYIEISEDVLKYLSAAVNYQIENMQIKRTRRINGKKSDDEVNQLEADPDETPGESSEKDPKKPMLTNQKPDPIPIFRYEAGGASVALKSVRTTGKDGAQGIRRYFSANTPDGRFSFSFSGSGSSSSSAARRAPAA